MINWFIKKNREGEINSDFRVLIRVIGYMVGVFFEILKKLNRREGLVNVV